MKLDYSMYLDIFGRYAQLGVFAAFVVGCFRLWRITARISLGFELIGRLVTIILFTALLLMAFGPQRVVLFRIIVYGSLSVWLFYTTWYFSTYPIPTEHLKANRVPTPPGSPLFLPKRALLKYLISESPETRLPWWHSHTFRTVGLSALGLLLLAYGFVQTINGYSWGFSLAATVQQKATVETKRAVSTAVQAAVDSTVKAIYAIAEPIQAGQQEIIDGQVKSDRRAVQRAEGVKQELRRATAKASRPAIIITTPAPTGSLPQSNFKLPSEVRPLPPPPPKRGRRYGYDYELDGEGQTIAEWHE